MAFQSLTFLTASVQFSPHFPQSLRYLHTHLVADNNMYSIRCEPCINSLHLVYFHHKTISSSPSCYKLKSSLTVLLKLLSQKPLMTWLPSPIASQSSSLFLYSSRSQPRLQIRSTKKIQLPGPHPGADLIGLGLAEGGFLLKAPKMILMCSQGQGSQLTCNSST